MNSNEPHEGNDVTKDALTVLTIPENKLDQVLDFVRDLGSSDDVSGHMHIGMLTGAAAGQMAAKATTHTGITTFDTGTIGTDLTWSDIDSIG